VSYYISTLTDPLPSGQKPIITSSLEDFMGFMTIIMDSRDDGYAVIGVVYGNAGLGKSLFGNSEKNLYTSSQHTDE